MTAKDAIFFNRVVDKKGLKKLVAWAYTNFGSARCATVADHIKSLGFRYATRAGVSISVDDLQVPPVKRQMLNSAEQEIRTTEQRYSRGEITEVERFQKVIDTWNSTSEALKDEVVRNFRTTNPLNSVYMMAFSGARGNMSQVRQLVGMRGLMADPQGEIIDLPIKTNFREGLTVTEYIISSYGARKGLVDTALRTADSGYLTRRLVDVSQDVIVREVDCGTARSLTVEPMKEGERTLIPLSDRLFGRVLAEDVEVDGEVIAKRNQAIDDTLAKKIEQHRQVVKVRSPLTCESARSVCQLCYGWSLAHNSMVDLGEAIGIIAAQSIGEPGTQLTMRTFHTGGVFTGEVARQIRAEKPGQISFSEKSLVTRRVRTRHGDERIQLDGPTSLMITYDDGTKTSHTLSTGNYIYVEEGSHVEEGALLAEEGDSKRQRSTERAVKDVSSEHAGEVSFEDLVPEEKTDRQGNMTRIAQRSGLLWVSMGEVYNLLPGAEPVVKNGQQVTAGTILAETRLTSSSGGIVRWQPDSGSREIEIITASVLLDQAEVRRETGGGRDQYLLRTASQQEYLLKTMPGSKVQNGAVIAELIDDKYKTATGGILKFADIETARGNRKQGYEITKGGTLLWIPEETHEVNKDISLLQVEDGQYVEAGTEVVKDVFCQSAGIVEVIQKNDILREIVIKPGEIHSDVDLESLKVSSGQLVYPGTKILPELTTDKLVYCEAVESEETPQILLRPVEEFTVSDVANTLSQGSINQDNDRNIQLRTIQRLFYKDGERVKSVDGVNLLGTLLILDVSNGEDSVEGVVHLNADIELVADLENAEIQRLQIVILESLVLRRDNDVDPMGGQTHTRVLVEDGQEITAGAVVAQTEIQCRESGEVRGIREDVEAIRRILIVRDADCLTVETPTAPSVSAGDRVVAGRALAEGVTAEVSAVVSKVKALDDGSHQLTLHRARPYRVSAGAILNIDDGDLVQRGDNLVLLVFERSKTGDIIQGLPRIEELLEARKPKEACVLSKRPGVCQVEYLEDETIDIKVIEADGVITDYPLLPGQSALVVDGQEVDAAEPLTDGPPNPHEILEVYFNYFVEEKGIYQAALIGLQNAQSFLVNQVQGVYQSQGIDISDKHIEVIVKQMTSKVRIDDGGDTTMLPGELVELRQVEQVNDAMSITGGAPARYTPVLLGITKASLNTDSFISAASFQETTRVLTEAAIEGKSDWLRGLKENVIIGRLIPAGTGFSAHQDFLHSLVEGGGSSDETGMRVGSPAVTDVSSPAMPTESDLTIDPAETRSRYRMNAEEDMILDDQTARAFAGADRLDNDSLGTTQDAADLELIDDKTASEALKQDQEQNSEPEETT